jgi:hypothetical protein
LRERERKDLDTYFDWNLVFPTKNEIEKKKKECLLSLPRTTAEQLVPQGYFWQDVLIRCGERSVFVP